MLSEQTPRTTAQNMVFDKVTDSRVLTEFLRDKLSKDDRDTFDDMLHPLIIEYIDAALDVGMQIVRDPNLVLFAEEE